MSCGVELLPRRSARRLLRLASAIAAFLTLASVPLSAQAQTATPTATFTLKTPIAIKSGKAFTLKGTADSNASPGETVTVTMSRKGRDWSVISTSTAVLSSTRTFTARLKTTRRGHWRISASLPATDTHLASSKTVQLKAVGSKVVALTFDDGPWPRTTARIAASLKKLDAQATFFVLGSQIHGRGSLMRTVVAGGSIIGVHSWNHAIMPRRSSATNRRDLARCKRAIRSATNTTPRWFRPPYGSTSASLRKTASREGLRQVIWTVDTLDWKIRNKGSIVSRALRSTRSGGVVLMHDGGGRRNATAAAVPTIVTRLRKKGYDFVTLDELAALGYRIR
jgi:peptidoglycan/xylan/chitin deacetylase (PgdA/CDA1 family)